MDLLEYRGKELFAAAGIHVLPSRLAETVVEAQAAAGELGYPLAVKAQVPAGGRGSAGGVRLVRGPRELAAAVAAILALTIKGKPVCAVLLEEGADVLRELYLAVTLDRTAKRPLLMFSARGGMDIEQLARDNAAALLRLSLDPLTGPTRAQVAQVVGAAGLGTPGLDPQLAELLLRLWGLYHESDATLVEVNPLAVVGGGPEHLVALDAKVTIDDNSLYRHPELAAWRSDEDERERLAREAGVSYVTLGGDLGVLANGAGLVMSTLDMVSAAGGAGAAFCDVGGGAGAERIAAALDIITGDTRVRALLVNIIGGITRDDEVARGMIAWRQRSSATLPLVVRLDGTNAEEGRELLAQANLEGLRVTAQAQEAVALAVAAARAAAPAVGPAETSTT